MALGALCAVAACQVAPEGSTADDVIFFEEALATIGCRLRTDADFRTVEFQAGLTRQQVLDIAGQSLGTGRAERVEDEGGIRLIKGPCDPANGSPRQVIEIAVAVESPPRRPTTGNRTTGTPTDASPIAP